MINEISVNSRLITAQKTAGTKQEHLSALASVTTSIQEHTSNLVTSFTDNNVSLRDGVKILQKLEKGTNKIENLLNAAAFVASKAALSANSPEKFNQLDAEFQNLISEIDQVANGTIFNGMHLLNNTGSVNIQFNQGGSVGILPVFLANLTTGSPGLNINGLNLHSANDAQAALSQLAFTAQPTVNYFSSYTESNIIQLSTIIHSNPVLIISDALDTAQQAASTITQRPNAAMLGQANVSANLVQYLLQD